jgi:hypothetical protein
MRDSSCLWAPARRYFLLLNQLSGNSINRLRNKCMAAGTL